MVRPPQNNTIDTVLACAVFACAVFSCAVFATGCGQRPVQQATDGAPETGDAGPAVDVPSPVPPKSPGQCLIAIRLDICCAMATPALQQHVAQDPCLVPYPHSGPTPAGCKRPNCLGTSCMDPRPKSRLVEAVPGGGCIWKSECSKHSDCALGVDLRQCCSGWRGFPKGLIPADRCLYVPGDDQTSCTERCLTPKCKHWPPASYPTDIMYGPRPYCWKSTSTAPELGLRTCGLGPV